MRRNLYNKSRESFLEALKNLGWVEQKTRASDRSFRKGNFHLILKNRKIGSYCVIHLDRYLLHGKGAHLKPITKGEPLLTVYHELIAEYKRLRSKTVARAKSA